MTEHEQIESALIFVDADDRETWWRVGAAIKSALGDDGKEMWLRWSARSDRFQPRVAEGQWRSFIGGRINIGSLFKLARDAGWKGTWDPLAAPRPKVQQSAAPDYAAQHKAAAEKAARVLSRTVWGPSAYLLNKGFQDGAARGFKDGEDLIVPMRDYWTGKLAAYQRITPSGKKLYLPSGCRVAETCFILNKQPHPTVQWWCEGYATGLRILAALNHGYRFYDQVVVCFSAANMTRLAGHPHRSRYQVTDVGVIDHDWWRCVNGHKSEHKALLCPECGGRLSRPAGETAWRKTGLPGFMLSKPGTDAADHPHAQLFAQMLDNLERGSKALRHRFDKLNGVEDIGSIAIGPIPGRDRP